MGISLYDLGQKYHDWLLRAAALDGVIDDEMLAEFEVLSHSKEDKLDAYMVVIKNNQAEQTALETEAKRIKERVDSLKANEQKLRKRLDEAMSTFGTTKYSSAKGVLSYRQSTAVEITDERKLLKKYFRVKKEVDKQAITEALKNNEKVRGAELVERRNLQIR